MTPYLGSLLALVRKDMLLEFRARTTLPAMLIFVIATFVVFHFSLVDASAKASAGMLWVALVFMALLGLTRSFQSEREQRLLDALALAPIDRSTIWLAKSLATLAFLLLAEAVAVPIYMLFFGRLSGTAIAGVALATVGIAAIGTLLAAMASTARSRELVLPLLFLPLAIPLVIGGVGATVAEDGARYLGFLALYDVLFATLCWASFDYVITE